METIGSYLREERQNQGKTLEQVAKKTRISLTTLRALEDDMDEQLPPASYLRGFLKLYAQELGLDVEEVLERLPQQEAEKNGLTLPPAPHIERQKKPILKICLASVLICIACIWAWKMFFGIAPVSQEPTVKIVSPRPETPSEKPEPQLTAPEAEPVTAEETSEPVPAAEQDTAAAKPDTEPESEPVPVPEPVPEPERVVESSQPEEAQQVAPERFRVKLIARGTVWMKLQADEGKAIDITLRSGERYSLSADRKLTARIGNPVLVDAFYNGEEVTLPGKPGIPLNVVFPDIVRQSAPEIQ